MPVEPEVWRLRLPRKLTVPDHQNAVKIYESAFWVVDLAIRIAVTIALLNRNSRTEIKQIVAGIEKIETAVEPRFQEHFVGAMAFPHKTAPFPNLAAVVTLPEKKSAHSDEDGEGGGRRRRRRG